MKEKIVNILSRVKNNPHLVKLICFATLSVAIIGVSLLASGVTVAYNVNYGGAVIGQIASHAEFSQAKQLAADAILAENAENYIYTPEFSAVLTLKSRNNVADTVAEGILRNTNEIAKGNALTVNGDIVAAVGESTDINAFLNNKLSSYNIEKYECSSEFVDDVKVVSTYSPVKNYVNEEKLNECLASLSVKTTVKETVEVKLSYKTVTNRTSSQKVGYYAVTTKGVDGLKHKVDNVTYLNGVEVGRESVEDVVVSEPVNQVVTVGTAPSNTGSGMIFPIPKSTNYYISTYYGIDPGDRKMHYGIDIAVGRGTPIYAALDGTVTDVGYRSDYGYYVVVEHSGGVKTRYAHNSQNLVKVGQTVAKGQTIALVGSTGRSTGNHLHFEVQVNGNRVNPYNYIG